MIHPGAAVQQTGNVNYCIEENAVESEVTTTESTKRLFRSYSWWPYRQAKLITSIEEKGKQSEIIIAHNTETQCKLSTTVLLHGRGADCSTDTQKKQS